MKSFFYSLLCLILILGSVPAFAQIGIGTTTPTPSAALEITSSTNDKGVLIPRLSNTQKNSISNPAEGLLIYQTSAPSGFYFFTNGAWKLIISQTNGKDLSSNDYTTADKAKVSNLSGTNTGDQTTITGNAGTATKLAAPKHINEVAFDGSGDITVTADAGTLTGNTLKSTVTGSGLTSVGTLAGLTVTNPIAGSVTGNAATATKLAATKNINGVAFDGSTDITIAAVAAAEQLSGTILKSTVTGSSLTSVGSLVNLTVTNPIVGSITGNAATSTTATTLATARKINNVDFDGSRDITITSTVDAGTLTGTLAVANGGTGSTTVSGARTNLGLVIGTNVQAPLRAGTDYLAPTGSAAGLTNFPTLNQNTTGTAATATTLITARKINDVDFDGSGDITVNSSAGTLTGANLNSTVTSSSLTSVGTLANLSVTAPITGSVTGSSGSTTGNAATVTNGIYSTNKLNALAVTSSAELAEVISNETGSGALVLASSPTLVTPVLGAATGTSLSVSGQLTSTVAIGTAPLVVTSTTPVANLNIGGNASSATNLAGGSTGSIPYQTASATTALLAKGTDGQILTLASGIPSWANAASGSSGSHTIGESYGGGKVFYVTTDGLHGLIAETQDQSSSCSFLDAQNIFSNSANHSTAGKLYTDWRLPTKHELNLLYLQKVAGTVSGFGGIYYWSSTEYSISLAWGQYFGDGSQSSVTNTNTANVRAIRAF
jgi:hypothetical protein